MAQQATSEFRENVMHMNFYRPFSYEQGRGDFPVAHIRGDQTKDLEFAASQLEFVYHAATVNTLVSKPSIEMKTILSPFASDGFAFSSSSRIRLQLHCHEGERCNCDLSSFTRPGYRRPRINGRSAYCDR